MKQRRRQVCTVLIAMVLWCVGCGAKQDIQDQSALRVTTGAAICIAENYDAEEVQRQLEVLVENAPKWRIAGDEYRIDDEIGYAVTDLDRNGRLEIIACKYDGYRNILQNIFEVTDSREEMEEIETDQMEEVSLGDMLENLDTAYYDPKTGECHYVIGNELSEEEILSDESEYFDKNIIALTLKQGRLTCDTLAYQTQTKNLKGKMQSRFYRIDDTGRTEIDPSGYNVESLGDAAYADCGKYSVQFSAFFFDNSLAETTEKQMYHALEKFYQEGSMGCPLGQQEKKIADQKIRIPQYSMMQDAGKQKRINRLIVEQVEQNLDSLDGIWDSEDGRNVDITIKYAGKDRVSLLLQADKSPQGEVQSDMEPYGTVVQGDVIYDTINIDLEQESLLSEQDLLPKFVRENVAEDIQEKIEEEGEFGQKRYSDDFYGNLIKHLEEWQDISLYQTRDMVGLVILTGITSDPYVICQVWNEWDVPGDVVFYSEVDWEAYQYRMTASEYQGLQNYMPVLTGETEFTYQRTEREDDDKETLKSQNMTISTWVEELFGEGLAKLYVNSVCICDITQDGKPELILDISNSMYLILHKEGNAYYGTFKAWRELLGLQKNGVYGEGREVQRLYQMRFDKDHFTEKYLGRYEWHIMKDGSIKDKYYIRDRKAEKEEYEKWEKSIMDGAVYGYNPEALDER